MSRDISRGLAKGLEYALDIPSSFWLNLQANYDAELLSIREEETIKEDEKNVMKSIHDVVSYLEKTGTIQTELSLNDKIIALRKHFQVSNLCSLKSLIPSGSFRISDKALVDPYVLGAWLCLCRAQGKNSRIEVKFDPARTQELISEIKKIMCNDSVLDPQETLRNLFTGYGIDFSIVHNFKGAPVHGYISKREEGIYQMVLTIRGAFADIFWFSLFHELGHIVNGDITGQGVFIDTDKSPDLMKEVNADRFAAEALISNESYQSFIENNSFSYPDIQSFSQNCGIPSYVVIGRLQKDQHIPWDRFTKYKPRYKWAE